MKFQPYGRFREPTAARGARLARVIVAAPTDKLARLSYQCWIEQHLRPEDIAAAAARVPGLGVDGVGTSTGPVDLSGSVTEVAWVLCWLADRPTTLHPPAHGASSYSIKHRVEELIATFGVHRHVSNGAAIVAALIADVPIRTTAGSRNATLHVDPRPAAERPKPRRPRAEKGPVLTPKGRSR